MMPAYFSRAERAAVLAPFVCTAALVCGTFMYGWLAHRFAYSFYAVVCLMPVTLIMRRLQLGLMARFRKRHARALWLPVVLLGLLLPMHAFAQGDIAAQADVLAGANSIATLPAAKPAILDADTFQIFGPMADGLLTGLDKVVADDAAALIAVVLQLTVPACSLLVIALGIIEATGLATPNMMFMVRLLIRFGVLMSIIGSAGDYARFVVEPGMHMGDQLMATVNATQAGAPGHVFDVLAAHLGGATVQAVVRLPFSVTHPGAAAESLVLALVAFGCYILGFIALAFTFIVYLAYAIYTAILLACGPLLLFGFMFPPLRGWAMGWVSALASQILGMLLLGIVLSIVVGVENRQLDAVLNLPDANNVWGTLGHLAGGMVVLIVGAGLAFLTRGVAVSIVGGTYTAMDQLFIGMRGASGFGSMASGGGGALSPGSAGSGVVAPGSSGSGMATASMAVPRSAP